MAVLMTAIVIATVINPQLDYFSGVMENAAPSNTPSSIYTNLDLAIPLVVIIIAVGILVYFVASTLNQEREYQTFTRILSEVMMYGFAR